jgi:hypothetical protein
VTDTTNWPENTALAAVSTEMKMGRNDQVRPYPHDDYEAHLGECRCANCIAKAKRFRSHSLLCAPHELDADAPELTARQERQIEAMEWGGLDEPHDSPY